MIARFFAGLFLSLAAITLFSGCTVPTFALKPRYVGEDTKCAWQKPTQCPPYVIYFNDTQRAAVALHVTNNLLYNVNTTLFDTSGADYAGATGTKAAIFVADAKGNLYASNQSKLFLLHHSSLMAGQPVVAAGELQVAAGVITTITNCSGHYQPDGALTKDTITKVLATKGYTRPFTYSACTPMQLERYQGESGGN